MEKDVQKAIELLTEAAELGSNRAHYELGRSYIHGDGVGQDTAKAVGHWERAAMKGDVFSRHDLGAVEYNAGNYYHLAIKHFLISAKMGYKTSLDEIKTLFSHGIATKKHGPSPSRPTGARMAAPGQLVVHRARP